MPEKYARCDFHVDNEKQPEVWSMPPSRWRDVAYDVADRYARAHRLKPGARITVHVQMEGERRSVTLRAVQLKKLRGPGTDMAWQVEETQSREP